MTLADKIAAINRVVQEYMRASGCRTLTADDAARLVHDAGVKVSECPSEAVGSAFREFLRGVSKEYGYDALHALMGATQGGNRPQGRYVIHRFDEPSRERIEQLIACKLDPSSVLQDKPTASGLPDYLAPGLDVVFVGISACVESAEPQHYYPDPGDKFWDLVNTCELVSDIVGAENDHLILDEKCGLSDLVKAESPASGFRSDDKGFNVAEFVKKMETYKPKIVALNGKQAYKEIFEKDPRGYGLADEIIGDSFVFVLPSSSAAETSLTYQQKLHWYRKLKATLRDV